MLKIFGLILVVNITGCFIIKMHMLSIEEKMEKLSQGFNANKTYKTSLKYFYTR